MKIQNGPKVRGEINLKFFFFLDGYLHVKLMPHIVDDVNQRCRIRSAFERSSLFPSI